MTISETMSMSFFQTKWKIFYTVLSEFGHNKLDIILKKKNSGMFVQT